MAKESEVPGQYLVDTADQHQRQLCCGCWVPLDHTGWCSTHGPPAAQKMVGALMKEPTREELQAEIRNLHTTIKGLRHQLALQHETWLDEVAARMAAGMLANPEMSYAPMDLADLAYEVAAALLDEGHRRREVPAA